MNERLKELAEQARFQEYFLGSGYIVRDQELQRFANLVRQDYLRELKALKPVAWMMPEYGDVLSASEADGTGIYNVPLYTAPQKYCPSENNAAYEKGFVEGMAKQMHSSVDRAVNAMAKP